MITQQAQIKINLPLRLKEFAESKAKKYDMPLAAYVKHLILKDVDGMDYPVYEASERTVTAYKKAVQDKKVGKIIHVTNVKKFLDEL